MQINNFQNIEYLKKIYNSEIVSKRGEFLKKYSNRKLSIRDIICKYYLDLTKPLDIMDIGPGNGSFLHSLYLKSKSSNFYALDIVKNQAFNKYPFVNFLIYDGINFPKIFINFDYIFCMHMLYHIEDFESFFSNIKKFLKPNGKIIITTKSINTLPHLEAIFKTIMKDCHIICEQEYRDESNFCTENALEILNLYFKKGEYSIEKNDILTQIIVDDLEVLLDYVLSTMRYNILKKISFVQWDIYLEKWKHYLKKQKIFYDEVRETIIIIKKRGEV